MKYFFSLLLVFLATVLFAQSWQPYSTGFLVDGNQIISQETLDDLKKNKGKKPILFASITANPERILYLKQLNFMRVTSERKYLEKKKRLEKG